MTEFSSLHSAGLESFDDKAMAQELDRVLEGINQLIAATQHAHSKVADGLGFSLQQITDYQNEQLIRALAIFGKIMGQARSNPSSASQALAPDRHAKFVGESSKLMIEKLVLLHELSAKHARAVVKIAQSQNDSETAALMDECITFHVKSAWMLRALLQ